MMPTAIASTITLRLEEARSTSSVRYIATASFALRRGDSETMVWWPA
jgi:hypothetical protein